MNELRVLDLETSVEEGSQEFKVTDLSGANWCFRKLKALYERKKEISLLAGEEIARIASWEEASINQISSDEEYFKSKIIEYYSSEKNENSKFKLTTPYGKVVSRNNKKWFYQDEEAIKTYMKENNDNEAIKVKEELNKTYIKSKYRDGINQETGEIVPGIEVVEMNNITVNVE